MATVREILDLAVGQGKKIEAIKLARECGIEAFRDTYNGKYIDQPQLGCVRMHTYDHDYKWVHSFESPGSERYECHTVLGLMEAKNAVEALMTKAQAKPVSAQEFSELEDDRAYWMEQYQVVAENLQTERRMARQNEQRLGKALKQVVGLKEKVEDRNSRLQDLARTNQELELLVRQYEHVISQRAVRQERELEFYG